jgi:hypothetical protein
LAALHFVMAVSFAASDTRASDRCPVGLDGRDRPPVSTFDGVPEQFRADSASTGAITLGSNSPAQST